MDESFIHEGIFSEDDLTYWEFVNSSETQSDYDVISLDDGFASSRSSVPKTDGPVEGHDVQIDGHCDCGIQDGDLNGDLVAEKVEHGDLRCREEEENVEDDVYDEDESNGDEYGLDDELVPWAVSGKFGRQRMRKLGKRSFSKMNHTTKFPYAFMKPGCVRGKHGLGLKHSV